MTKLFIIFVYIMKSFEPYYIAIFTSVRSGIDEESYERMNIEMSDLVEKQEGFLGAEGFSNEEGKHVAIVKFKSETDMINWKNHSRHKEAQQLGREKWYEHYNVKVCKVEREYEFNKNKE